MDYVNVMMGLKGKYVRFHNARIIVVVMEYVLEVNVDVLMDILGKIVQKK